MELKKIQTDPARENEGVWINFDEDTEFLLGSVNSRRYREAFQKGHEELRRKGRMTSDADRESANIKIYAQAIVLNWRGFTNDGKEFPCNPENAELVLKTCPSVRDFVFLTASNHENFRAQMTEEAKAHLGESSAGV